MIEKQVPVLSIILYVLSVLLMAYVVWSLIYSYNYISNLVSAGQLIVKGNLYDVFSFYMSNCAMYFLFAVVFLAIGRIMQKGMYMKQVIFTDDDFEGEVEEDGKVELITEKKSQG